MPTSSTYSTATTLHTGGDGFIQALRQDLAKATHSIVVQVMSFEADQAGQQIVELLSNYPPAPAATTDRCLLNHRSQRYMDPQARS